MHLLLRNCKFCSRVSFSAVSYMCREIEILAIVVISVKGHVYVVRQLTTFVNKLSQTFYWYERFQQNF